MNRSACILVFLAGHAFGQTGPAARGHWEGTLKIPNSPLKVALDLDVNVKGEWIGSFDIPAQNLRGLPLKDIVTNANMLTFKLDGVPGDPAFDGEISPDNLFMKGDFIAEGGGIPAELKLVSEPKVVLPAKSTAITKELEGDWEGAIALPDGKKLRTRVTFASDAAGRGSGKFVSLDQGNAEFPITSVTQEGSTVKFEIRGVGGTYAGELKGGELVGTWAQGMGSMPLNLKRASR